MDLLQSILVITLTPAFIVGALAFVFRVAFQQLLSRDIENYKARLQAESDQAKLRLQYDLQTRLFDYQTRFSLLHTKRAEVIIELYGMLTDSLEWIGHAVSPVQYGSDEDQLSRRSTAGEKYNALVQYFQKHRPYLDEQVCE